MNLSFVVYGISVGGAAMAGRYFYLRLFRPEYHSAYAIERPFRSDLIIDYALVVAALIVMWVCFFHGFDWMLSWVPDDWGKNPGASIGYRGTFALVLSFAVAVILLGGVEHLGDRIRRAENQR